MFSKQRNKTKLPTIIGEDAQFSGNIISSGEVQVDGQVIGDVHATTLKVHKNATIKGDITAGTIELYGEIIGNVHTRTIHMLEGSRIEGDVLHQDITIETGAFINGACQHLPPENVADESSDKKKQCFSAPFGCLTPAFRPHSPR